MRQLVQNRFYKVTVWNLKVKESSNHTPYIHVAMKTRDGRIIVMALVIPELIDDFFKKIGREVPANEEQSDDTLKKYIGSKLEVKVEQHKFQGHVYQFVVDMKRSV